MRILSGVQASGALHLGNYFGALRQFVALQGAGEALYFVADWHALTSLRDGAAVRRASHDVVLDYLALGLDPSRAILFRQSDVPQHVELMWVLSTVCPMGLLERGHSYKDQTARGAARDAGLLTYPVLMAADILLYNADRVPVGQDQRQHLEMARDMAQKFNVAYVQGYDPNRPKNGVFRLPEAHVLDEDAVVPGLDGQKMSKSYGNTLPLFLPEAAARKKIMAIVTDATPVEAPKPAGAPLLALLQLLADEDEAAAHARSWRAGGVGYGTYKKRLVELYLAHFAEASRRRAALAAEPGAVERVLAEGAERAREVARPQWNRVVELTGCGRPL